MARVANRPKPEQWADEEPMTLFEAAAVFFPDGPLTVASLRTTIRNGDLGYMKCAGKILTTPGAVKEMVKPQLRVTPCDPVHEASPQPSRPFSIEDGRRAQAQGLEVLAEQRARLRARRNKPNK